MKLAGNLIFAAIAGIFFGYVFLSKMSLLGPISVSMPTQSAGDAVNMPIFDYVPIVSLVVLLVVIAVLVLRMARTVRPTERGLVERLGKYHHFASPGLTFLIPFLDRLIRINITETMSHVEPQEVITKDKVVMTVDAVVFFKVKPDEESVKASVYAVNNFVQQIEVLARTTLRNIIGKMEMGEANVGRGIINTELLTELEQQSVQWGVEIMRAELKDLRPPSDIQESMNTVIKANNTKLANTDLANAAEAQADGQRRAAIKNAEGQRQAAILAAEGQKIAIEKVAEGNANAIKAVNEAYTTYFKGTAIVAKQLETIATSLQNNSKIIVPEGNTLSLILNESDQLGKKLIVPIATPTKDKSTSASMG